MTKKKNILMITRLFTGFERSLKEGVWQPEGVPTVYNFINRASKKYNLTVVLACKDSGKTYSSNWNSDRDQMFSLKGLDSPVIALAGASFFGNKLPRKLLMMMRDIRHLLKIFVLIRSRKPDLIYCDGANVTFAFGITKIFPNTPVVLRLLGICSFLRSLPDAKRLVHRIYKFAFSGKFALAIGTQDGTGTEFFFRKMLTGSVPNCILLNGTDIAKPSVAAKKRLPLDWVNANQAFKTILFVGRLEEDKGIRLFIDGILGILSGNAKAVRAVIVGSGSLLEEMKYKVLQSGYNENFQFTGSVPHEQILGFHYVSDIYVSTNIDGNLTNANLEAIAANACMLLPTPQHEKHIDVQTTEYLGDAVCYYNHGDPEDLKIQLLKLISSPQKRRELARKLKKQKQSFMRSWDDRVEEEIQMLDRIMSSGVK